MTSSNENTDFDFSPLLKRVREKYNLPGIGLAVVTGKRTSTYVSGVRKWGDFTPITIEDNFHLASCTKAMAATVIAMFVEKGVLDWDSPMESVFPEFAAEMDKRFRQVSVAMLTAHRAGLTGDLLSAQSGEVWRSLSRRDVEPSEGRRLVTRMLLCASPETAPGSQYRYSNAGYIVAGAILERITGKRWEQIMKEELFDPLEMRSCGFGVQASAVIPPDGPWPHVYTEGIPTPVTPERDADNPPALGPAGTVHASLGDWAKFARFHIRGFHGELDYRVSSLEFTKLHESYPGQEETYGGWIRVNRKWAGGPALTSCGSNTMNFARIWLAPLNRAALLCATNIGGSNADNATDDLCGHVINACGWAVP